MNPHPPCPVPHPPAPPETRVAQEMDRMTALLDTLIRERGLQQKHLCTQLGWKTSYLSHLLTGRIRLRFGHLLELLAVLGVEAGDFFARLWPDPPPPWLFAALGGETAAKGPATAPKSSRWP